MSKFPLSPSKMQKRRPTFRANHRTFTALFVFLLSLPCGLFSQSLAVDPARLVIPDHTPVKLRLAQTISSAHARSGERLDFIVTKDVTVGGLTIIRAGAVARGSVFEVKGKRFLGIGGQVGIKLHSVALITGEKVRLHASKEIKGRSHWVRMAVGMAVTSLLYLPAAPVFLLSRGDDSSVLKGTEVTAYIDGDSSVPSANLPSARENPSELKEMSDFLPARVLNDEGREGDMLNLILIAQKEDLERAFEQAGWVRVDKSKPAVIFWHLLCQRTHYTKLPMAKYYVFGRVQDYSYAMPDPASILTRRHHLRIWRTDYEVDGKPIWVGAATHDVAIVIEKRRVRFDHRIDPRVDAERDFIASNLAETLLVTHKEYLASADPVFEAQTTRGQTYYSDSRMVLLELDQAKPGSLLGDNSSPASGSAAGIMARY
jgi:LssY-like putative type I secretion system component LssY